MADLDVLKNASELQQYKRMKFLDFLLNFRGWFTRQDLINEFKVAPAGATRDIAKYKSLTLKENSEDESRNFNFNDSLKKYVKTNTYKAEYSSSFESSISLLRRALKKGYIGISKPIPIESPSRLCSANNDFLLLVTRAISNESCLSVKYSSMTSGDSERTIAPHSLFESETNWYVRAFCYKRNGFRSFKLSRFTELNFIDEKRVKESNQVNDDQWQRWVNLILEPHPHSRQKEVLAHDYGMDKVARNEIIVNNCAKEVKVRAAICGFWLQHWNVDCSDEGILGKKDRRYLLKLANPEALYDVDSATLAPGWGLKKD